MIFTNADPRYAGRFDDKQGGDTIMTMERVREAIAFNADLADESTWLWLTPEQMGFSLRPTGGGEHEERAQDLDSSQRVRDRLVAYHLAPAINNFISDENRVCCNNDLEQTPMLLHSSLGWAGRFPGLDSPLTYLLKAVRHQRIAISNQVGGNVECLTLRLP